ncbi:MAG: methionyl-tRNA formyltransferase, methionyl-tRNA formyltransferase [Candidatus Berkelbacteria bacterium]|nr:methionyl-tRNA formyltransferase, methionyl-tRNA formyltransferase [Candidatus Berkelbacteria bacterium]
MKNLSIVTIPNTKLMEVTQKVASFDNVLKNQIKDMVRTLRKEGGIGLAANQLGFDNQVIVAEFKDPDGKEHIPLSIYINPEIVRYSEKQECLEEGCLSVPKIELEIDRPEAIKIRYQDQAGKKYKIAPKGLIGRILQHEIDHLNGIVFTERAKDQFFIKFPEFKNIKIAFFGSGEFAAIILEGLILLGLNLDIYTEESKPSGRDQKIKLTPVAEIANKFRKDFFEIEASQVSSKVNRGGEMHGQGRAERLDPISSLGKSRSVLLTDTGERPFDLLICSDFGQKIPKNILNKAKITAINVHPSLLPKYLGPTPIQAAILNGDQTTGVSVIRMVEKIDEGPIYSQIETEILKNDIYPTLRDRLATLGLKLVIHTLPKLVRDELEPMNQDLSKKIMTHKFTKTDGEIDWAQNIKDIDRKIRAFFPWPGTYTFVDNKRLIIHEAHIKDSKLVLDIIQLEGKKPIEFKQFLQGFKGQKPEWFAKIKLSN